jgi:hypothetical protein
LRQFHIRQPAVALQLPENGAVDRIELRFGIGVSHSVLRGMISAA